MRIDQKIYCLIVITLFTMSLLWQPATAQEDTATYSVTFDALWSADSPHPHPNGMDPFPSSAHFSPLVGAVHNSDVSFWASGELATVGIESMAELGSTSVLLAEVDAAIAAGTALASINGPDVFPSPGVANMSEIQVTSAHPLVSLVTMIAPSPDWFLGVSGLSLRGANGWEDRVVVDLHAYDAGTEEGTGFSISNNATEPHQTIQPLSQYVLGRFTFTRTDTPLPRETNPPLPDLVLESVTIDPPNPQVGSTVNVQVVIRNQGDGVAGGFRAYLYWNSPDRPPTATTVDTSNTFYGLGLGPGQTLEWRNEVNVTSTDLSHYVWVDRDNQVAESNEENNLYAYPSEPDTPTPTPSPTPTLTPPPPTATPTVTPSPTVTVPPQEDGPDIYEDDDTCQQAKFIPTDGTAQQRNLYATDGEIQGDYDWVRFDVVTGVAYHIVVSPNGEAGRDADVELEAHIVCDSLPDFGQGQKEELRFIAMTTGTYYLLIKPSEGDYGPNTDYTLTIVADSGCSDHYEPNDSCPRASGLVVNAAPQDYRFCQIDDVDWMQFEGKAGLQYEVGFENMDEGADAQIEIHGSCQPSLEALHLGGDEVLKFRAPTDGPIYLRLTNREDTHGTDTNYQVWVNQIGETNCGPDDFEEDDDLASARVISINGDNFQRRYNTCPANDPDWVTFQPEIGKTYLIETINLAVGSDPLICLYGPDKNLIECDTDGGQGLGAKIIWQADSSESHYLELRDEDQSVAGPETAYTLNISTNLCQEGTHHEPNDSINEAGTLIPDSTVQLHTFCRPDDQDWVKFDAQPGRYVIIADPKGVDVDTTLALYDSGGNRKAENNDFGNSFGSRIEYNVDSAGPHYILARPQDPNGYGIAAEYHISVQYEPAVTPTPVPTYTPETAPTPTPTPPPGEYQTLILVHRNRLAQLYDDGQADRVVNKLQALAQHDEVKGEVVRLDQDSDVSLAYDTWFGNQTDIQYANQVTDAIKRLILRHLDDNSSIKYVVLVGDDRALPFRRVKDPTANVRKDFTASFYTVLDTDTPTGAALRANYILTDDFYIDRDPNGFFIPDSELSAGRLVENPNQIINTIDRFLESTTTKVDQVMVTGYDFLQDSAEDMCRRWTPSNDSANQVFCELIGDDWSGDRLREAQQVGSYQIQSINGHATHDAQGVPNGQSVSASDVASGSSSIGGSLLYTVGCHAGLNVPDELDLVEAFVGRGAAYIGNTDYGWGYRNGIGLSEKLMQFYTALLTEKETVEIGPALVAAKNQYYERLSRVSSYDKKIMQQVILYGLPMQKIQTENIPSFGVLDEPQVDFIIEPTDVQAAAVDNGVTSYILRVVRDENTFNNEPAALTDGQVYQLNDHTISVPGQPRSPGHVSKELNGSSEVAPGTANVRAIALRSATYTTRENFDPVVESAYNEYNAEDFQEESIDPASGWIPALPTVLRNHQNKARMITNFSQYNASSRQLRLLDNVNVKAYFSDSADQIAPEITFVSGLWQDGMVTIRAGVTDASGVMEVLVSWYAEEENGTGLLQTRSLTREAGSSRWQGTIAARKGHTFFIQAVDSAGNVSVDHNDGHYYQIVTGTPSAPLTVTGQSDEPEEPEEPEERAVYLPVIMR